jgi:hypothetical protein
MPFIVNSPKRDQFGERREAQELHKWRSAYERDMLVFIIFLIA